MSNREQTEKLLEMMDEGVLETKDIVIACVKYMTEDEVADMMESNEWSDRFMDMVQKNPVHWADDIIDGKVDEDYGDDHDHY